MFAYAKVNLALAITGIRPDGFHELQTIMQSLALADRLIIERQGREIVCECGELSGPQNLAFRAAKLFFDKLDFEDGIKITIEKRIPVQAGLGGGSSDAAAVLMGLNQLYDAPLSFAEIFELANRLGSDVPFCLKGGTKWAEGRGEILSDLPSPPDVPVVLAKPKRGVNTAMAYRKFDETQAFSHLDRTLWDKALTSGDIKEIAALFHNDLEKPCMELVPEIRRTKALLAELGCFGVLMTGSGSAVFGIVEDEGQAEAIVQQLAAKEDFDGLALITRFQKQYH